MNTESQINFEFIHSTRMWDVTDYQNRVCRDHFGSTICASTTTRKTLIDVFSKYGIGSMVDLGCGTFHWMRYLKFPNGLHYHGVDICPSKIEENRLQFPNLTWSVGDVIEDELPKADLYLMRDVLCYQPDHRVLEFFSNIRKVNSGLLLVSSHIHPHTNATLRKELEEKKVNENSCKIGEYRHVDLLSSPFTLNAKPLEVFEDHRPCLSDRPRIPFWAELHLYRIEDLT